MRLCWRTRPSLKDVVGAGDREMNAVPGSQQPSGDPVRHRVGWGPVLTRLSSAGCLSGEAATSAGPAGGPCTTPRRCSVTAGASTAAAFCAVSLLRSPIHLLQAEDAVNKADTPVPVASACLSSWTVHAPSLPARTATQTPSLASPRHLPSIRLQCTLSCCLPRCAQSAPVSVVWRPAQSLAHPRGLAAIPG